MQDQKSTAETAVQAQPRRLGGEVVSKWHEFCAMTVQETRIEVTEPVNANGRPNWIRDPSTPRFGQRTV